MFNKCESGATATNVFCAKAERQQQQIYNRVEGYLTLAHRKANSMERKSSSFKAPQQSQDFLDHFVFQH
jgi:hypothetical protein